MKERSILLVILIFCMGSSLAQEAIVTAGEDGTGSEGSVSFSIGQILYTVSGGSSGEVLHGVQQPYEIYIVSIGDQFQDLGISLSIYPNPVTDILILKVQTLVWSDLDFRLYSNEGRILLSGKLSFSETKMDMSQLAAGVYLLQVNLAEDALKTFKIVKR